MGLPGAPEGLPAEDPTIAELLKPLDFMDRTNTDGDPFFLWFNSTRMHIGTRLTPEAEGVTGQGVYADGMVEHDGHVGQLLDTLDELGITDNTICTRPTTAPR